MKKMIVLILAVFAISNVWAQSGSLPNTQIKDLKTNKKVDFNNTVEEGKVTLVNFWAT